MLEVGKVYSNAELAEWFGITEKTFRNYKRKKLEELSEYVEFQLVKNNKVQVLKILDPSVPCIFVKKRSDLYMRCKEQVPQLWKKGEPETASRVAHKIYSVQTDDYKIDSYKRYVAEVRNELWGNPKELISQCHYVLAKMWKLGGGEYARYELLTEEENQKVRDLYDQMSNGLSPEEKKDKEILLGQMIQDGTITEAEAWKMYTSIDYVEFLFAASNMLGCECLVKATLVEKEAKDGEWKKEFSE